MIHIDIRQAYAKPLPVPAIPVELKHCLYCDCHYVEEEYVAERAACVKCQELFELYEE